MNIENMHVLKLGVGKFGLVDCDTGKVLVEITPVIGTPNFRVGKNTYINLSFAEKAAREIVRKRL